MGKKPIVSVTYENERISIKNSLPYIKWVLGIGMANGTSENVGLEKFW